MSPLHRIIARKNPALAADLERQLQERNLEGAERLKQLQRAVARCKECEVVLSIADRDFVMHADVMTARNCGTLTPAQEWRLLDIESRLDARMSERSRQLEKLWSH